MTKNYSLVQSLLNIYEHFMEKKDQLQYLPVNQNSKNEKRWTAMDSTGWSEKQMTLI